VHCEWRREEKKGRTFLWESWDVGSTIPTSTQSASGIIQEQRVSAETGHRCWWIVSKTFLYVGDNRRVVGMDVKYSCKQVQNLQTANDIISTAEDTQYDGGRLSWSYETWSLTIKEGYRLRVSESGGLRKTLGPEREEVTGGWRKLKSEELHALNSSPNTTQTLEIAHHYHPTRKRLPGRSRKRWKWNRNH